MKNNRNGLPFLSSVDWMDVTQQLSNLLPDEAFFIKDKEGRFMMQNNRLVENCRVTRAKDPSGMKDDDFWSEERVRMYIESDRQVMSSGRPIINELAPAPEETGSNNMILYSKFPIRDHDGEIIGVGGFYRLIDEKETTTTPLGKLYNAIRKIQQNYADNLTASELARLCSLSRSQFERRFRKVLGCSPREYLMRVRVRSACRVLEQTDWTIARTAQECGFYDHSHFSHAFRRLMGVSPSIYRKNHGVNS